MVSMLGGAIAMGAAILLSLLAFGGDRFTAGIGYGTDVGQKFYDTKGLIDEYQKRTEDADRRREEKFDELLRKLDRNAQQPK